MNVPSSSTTAPKRRKPTAASMATVEGANTQTSCIVQSVAVEQFDNNSNKRQPPMRNIQIAAFRGRDPDNPFDRKHPSCGRFRQRMEINVLGITNTLTSVGKDNMAYIEYE